MKVFLSDSSVSYFPVFCCCCFFKFFFVQFVCFFIFGTFGGDSIWSCFYQETQGLLTYYLGPRSPESLACQVMQVVRRFSNLREAGWACQHLRGTFPSHLSWDHQSQISLLSSFVSQSLFLFSVRVPFRASGFTCCHSAGMDGGVPRSLEIRL